jgi:hypothetical protein
VSTSDSDFINPKSIDDSEWKQRAEAFFEGKMSAAESAAFERELVADPALAQAVYTQMGMGPVFHEALQALRIRHLESHARLADRSISKHVPWWGRTRSRFVVTVVVAALVFTVVVVSKLGEPSRDIASEKTLEATGFRGLSPAGNIQALPTQFSWLAHPTAAHYRIEIHDESSQLVYSTLTNQTSLIVAVDRLVEKGFRAGYWLVVPLDEHGAELGASRPVEITATRP